VVFRSVLEIQVRTLHDRADRLEVMREYCYDPKEFAGERG
jgi:hypothetical protein